MARRMKATTVQAWRSKFWARDPGEGSLRDPPFRQDDEAVRVGALDDLQRPATGRGGGISGSSVFRRPHRAPLGKVSDARQ